MDNKPDYAEIRPGDRVAYLYRAKTGDELRWGTVTTESVWMAAHYQDGIRQGIDFVKFPIYAIFDDRLGNTQHTGWMEYNSLAAYQSRSLSCAECYADTATENDYLCEVCRG